MASQMYLCRPCFIEYPLEAIQARKDPDSEGSSWSEILSIPVVPPPSRFRRIFRKGATVEPTESIEGIKAGFDPYCPEGHLMLDVLSRSPMTVAVIGNVNSSKSSFILGLVEQLIYKGALNSLGIGAAGLISQYVNLRTQLDSVYGNHVPLDASPEKVRESFAVTLTFPDSRERTLLFYDISGEVLKDPQKLATVGRFLYSAEAVIVLLDPDGFPKRGQYRQAAGDADPISWPDILAITQQIELAASQSIGSPAKFSDLSIPIILTVAKADAVAWKDKWWPVEPDTERKSPKAIFDYLDEVGKAVRDYLHSEGLGDIVDSAEREYGSRNVSFSRVSALNCPLSAESDGTVDVRPVGCWQPLIQILRMKGLIDPAPADREAPA